MSGDRSSWSLGRNPHVIESGPAYPLRPNDESDQSTARSPARRRYDQSDQTTIPRPADAAAWLELRRPYWNASAAAALFHEHPFLTLASVVRSKLDAVTITEENAAMRRGRHLEAAIASWWSEEHGIAVYEPDVVYVNGPLMATLDRRIVGVDSAALEIKTSARHVSAPERYWIWQVLAQMHCAGLERVHLAVLDATMTLATYTVERDDDAIDRLVEAATDVVTHIRFGTWPPTVVPDPPIRHTDRIVELDNTGVEVLQRWLAVRSDLDALEVEQDSLRRQLVGILGDAQAATVDGRQVLTYRSHTRSSIDLALLRREHPDLAHDLSIEQTVRVLRSTKTPS